MRTRSPCRSRSAWLALPTIAVVVLAIGPAAAAPSSVSLDAVYRARDCNPACNPEDDTRLKAGARVAGTIQMHASASSDVVGLDFVRLEAQLDPDPRFYCLQQWNPGGNRQFAGWFDWETKNWPGPNTPQWGCTEASPHKHGSAASNGIYRLRVTAAESVNGEQASSDEFLIKIDNPTARTSQTQTPCPGTCGNPKKTGGATTIGSPSPSPKESPGPTGSASAALSVAAPPLPTPSLIAAGVPRPRSPISRPLGLFLATVMLGLTGWGVLRNLGSARP